VRELLELFGVYLRESKPKRRMATPDEIDRLT
jgi:hypothetical protein